MKEIQLTQGKTAFVDDSDYEQLNRFNWQYSSAGYATRQLTKKADGRTGTAQMHRLIMKASKGLEVDHIDHNRLNNQRSNLRLCTRQQNMFNRSKDRNKTTSKYKGVYLTKRKSRPYAAYVSIDGAQKSLGYYETELQAAYAYDVAAIKEYGEYAEINNAPPCDLAEAKRIGGTNVSGIPGIQYCTQHDRYRGMWKHESGKKLFTKFYKTAEEAAEALEEYKRTGVKPQHKRYKPE